MPKKLHVEAIRKTESNVNSRTLSSNIKNELKNNKVLFTGTKICDFSDNLKEHIEAIYICELEVVDENDFLDTRHEKINEEVDVSEVSFCLHMFRLNRDGAHTEMMDGGTSFMCGDGADMIAAQYWTLPSIEFHGLWDNLIFDSNIKTQLLHYCWTMAEYGESGIDTTLVACNRVILLYGPPGTGKTSLCKALASKLAVRMSHVYDHTILVEVNTHSLFSKYFSESGKLVTKLFDKINELAFERKVLVCVLIDEVESLAHSRAAASNGTEPSDSFRVVNSVLTQLDSLRTKPNVLVMTTSNITSAIDLAFVDRADIKKFIPEPSSIAIYSILYSSLTELIRVGKVLGPLPERLRSLEDEKLSNGHSEDDPQSLLIQLSLESRGLSGRGLRKIPLLAHAYYLNPSRVSSLTTFLKGMVKVIRSHKEDLEIINSTNTCSKGGRNPNV